MHPHVRMARPMLMIAALLAASSAVACKKSKKGAAPEAATGASAGEEGDAPPAPPPLPADAPRIAAISLKTEIFERPDPKSRVLGYLRLGQNVRRTPDKV